TGLHVEDAWAVCPTVLDAEGALGERADRPDAVVVAEDQRGLAFPAAKERLDVLPARFGRVQSRLGAGSGQPVAQVSGERVAGVFVGRGGLELDDGVERLEAAHALTLARREREHAR